jgi:hypothetical protein
MIKLFRTGLVAAAAVGTLGITSVLAVNASTTVTSFTASTTVTNRDDSGTNSNGTTSNWAKDNFTRVATIYFHGLTVQSHCPGIGTGLSCYSWSGNIVDMGHFTTVVGDAVPGKGYLNGGAVPIIATAVTGNIDGKYLYVFYTDQSASTASGTHVPTTLSGDSPTTTKWVEQFFTPGSVNFWDSSGATGGKESPGTTGGWTYAAFWGTNPACPNVGSRWVDASPSWGSTPASGNILAPDAMHC